MNTQTIERDAPFVEVAGERWYEFGIDYQHDGKTFTVQIMARSWDEAIEMCRSLRGSADVYGQHIATIPAGSALAGWRVSLACWVRNFLGITPTMFWRAVAFMLLLLLILK